MVCTFVCFNTLLMHEHDLVFGGFLVINYLSFFGLVMAELISDFHSYQEKR